MHLAGLPLSMVLMAVAARLPWQEGIMFQKSKNLFKFPDFDVKPQLCVEILDAPHMPSLTRPHPCIGGFPSDKQRDWIAKRNCGLFFFSLVPFFLFLGYSLCTIIIHTPGATAVNEEITNPLQQSLSLSVKRERNQAQDEKCKASSKLK